MEELFAATSDAHDRPTIPSGKPTRPASPPSQPPPKPTYRESSDAWLARIRHRTPRDTHAHA